MIEVACLASSFATCSGRASLSRCAIPTMHGDLTRLRMQGCPPPPFGSEAEDASISIPITQIPARFHDLVNEQGGCRIKDTAQRPITLEQLRQILKHVEGRLGRGEVLSHSLIRSSCDSFVADCCIQELSYLPEYEGASTRTIDNVEHANLYGEAVACDLTVGDIAALADRHQHVGDSSSDERGGVQPGGNHGQWPD